MATAPGQLGRGQEAVQRSTVPESGLPTVGVAPLELSVVIPCLDEADTLETCISKAQTVISEHAIAAEIVVADNGSADGSQEIATRMGARLIHVERRGYGEALMAGI